LPRSAAPEWRRRKEPVLDEYIRASIREAEGKCHPETGHYSTLVIHGIESREEAAEVKRALYRAALWLHRNTDLNCSMSAKPKKNADGTYRVEFRAINKDHAYAYMVKQYGEDQTKWPYSTNRFHPNYNSGAKE
jgi:hypothetical protein